MRKLSLAGLATVSMLAALGAGFSSSASAETQWEKDHPRRDQVNDRLANQNHRITQEVKEGEMSKAEAARLRSNDRTIRSEERAMASQDHGHITKADQRALNQQLNANSRKIGN